MPNVSISPQPKLQFFDSNGDPLSGGKLYSYDAGTTTPRSTYTDSTGSIANTNPVILDTRGEASVWLDSSLYKLVLKTASDVSVWTVDNINGPDQATLAALAASGGSALVGFIQSGTGAVTRTAQAKMRETVSVKDFGAVGDGSTNDYAAVQAAVNYASTFTDGAKVYFPAGKYRLNTTVTIAKSGVVLEGDGDGNTWIINGTTNSAAIQFGDDVSTFNRNKITNFVFGQASGVTPTTGNCGLYAVKCSNFTAQNIQVFQFPSSLRDGIVFVRVSQSVVSDFGLQTCLKRGLAFETCLDVEISNIRSDANETGFEVADSQGLYANNVTCYQNTKNAYRFRTAGNPDINEYLFFVNCIGDTSGEHNWLFEQCSMSVFNSCWASTQLVPITGGNWDGFHLLGADVEELTFSNCVAISNNRHGMNIARGYRIQVNGGVYGSNFRPAGFGGLGQRNGLAGAGSGILVGADTSYILISNARMEHNASYGIDVAAGAQNVEILGCETRFNLTQSIRNLANGSTAQCRIKDVAGYNPFPVVTPAVPASTVVYTNLFGVDANVYITGGTVTNVVVNGISVLASTPASVFVPAGGTIAITYSVAPTWQWIGN